MNIGPLEGLIWNEALETSPRKCTANHPYTLVALTDSQVLAYCDDQVKLLSRQATEHYRGIAWHNSKLLLSTDNGLVWLKSYDHTEPLNSSKDLDKLYCHEGSLYALSTGKSVIRIIDRYTTTIRHSELGSKVIALGGYKISSKKRGACYFTETPKGDFKEIVRLDFMNTRIDVPYIDTLSDIRGITSFVTMDNKFIVLADGDVIDTFTGVKLPRTVDTRCSAITRHRGMIYLGSPTGKISHFDKANKTEIEFDTVGEEIKALLSVPTGLIRKIIEGTN